MKNFKKHSIKLIAIAICLSAGIFFGFKPTKQNHAYQNLKENFDGETIFRGVYFGNKTVGQFIPDAFEGSVDHSDVKNLTIENSLLNEIKKTDPNFFTSFKSKIESGNPISVDEAITAGTKLLSKLMVKKQILAASSDDQTDNATARYSVKDWVVYKHVEQSIIIDVDLYYPYPLVSPTSSVSKKGLEREKLMNYIAQNLKK